MLAHLDWARDASQSFPTKITEQHIGRACYLVGEHFRRHAHRAYGIGKQPPEIIAAKTIAQIIKGNALRTFKVRDILN